jgi:AraC-like DNA-binding protein
LGLVWYLMRNSPTLGRALSVLVDYSRLLTDFESHQLHSSEGLSYITIAFDDPSALNLRFAAQIRVGYIARCARELLGVGVTPREVDLPFARPGDLSAYRRVLGVEPRFRCRRARVAFTTEELAVEVPGADPSLLKWLELYARRIIDDLPEEESFAQLVRRVMFRELQGGAASVQHVARKLGVSSRTLQRRLGEAGLSFQEIMEDQRSKLAIRYLADEDLTVSEIGFLLGFSSASAFNHAFKRWAGVTPGQHRRNHMSQG